MIFKKKIVIFSMHVSLTAYNFKYEINVLGL